MALRSKSSPPDAVVNISRVTEDVLYHQYETINIFRRGPGATLQLNRPERMNAWSDQFSLDLLSAVRQVSDDAEVRAVVITGAAGPSPAAPT